MILLRIYDDRERNFLFTLAISSRLIKLTKLFSFKAHPPQSLVGERRNILLFAHETNDY